MGFAGLSNAALWDERSTPEEIERRVSVNDNMLLNLIDARRCAGVYLKQSTDLLTGEIKSYYRKSLKPAPI